MGDERKIALVTGANKGIGLEVARQLGKAGWVVLLGARDAKRGRAAESKLKTEKLDARFVELDVVQSRTISLAASKIREEFGRLDVLVNNAGIVDGHDGPPSSASVDAVARIMGTNFLGTVGVTQAMLPLIRKSAAGKIINVSSGLGSLARHGNPTWDARYDLLGYSSSKAALNMFTVQLAFELKNEGIAVNSVGPGYTATDLNEHKGHQTVEQGAAEIVRLALLEQGPTGGYFETAGSIPW
ncbi:MAG TPA: SDR family oxidoreductase [Candidatus Acidoferrales bacterium]|jgi:NAD(P)-dependent dehydrogenase (short-subunit alcohol dehydrogenase family)|nr:SDR family oxidoreductase [Candidatus Acidoferrales bacterium]